MKKDDIESWDPLKFYDRRIKELETLKQQSNSQTLKELISKAIIQSKESLQNVLAVQKETVAYVNKEKIKSDEAIAKIDEQIALLSEQLQQIDSINDATEQQISAAKSHLTKVLELGIKTKRNREEVMRLQYAVMPKTALEFQKLLLDLIYKPNASNFHYDTIVDALKYLGGLFIPGFDSLMTVSDNAISVAMRKKQYIKSGDKILVYLEQYLDVLNKWETLAGQYLKILRE